MHQNNIVFLLEMFRKNQNDILYRDAIFKNVPITVKSGRLETLSILQNKFKMFTNTSFPCTCYIFYNL